jgi:hypothetical protein
MLAHWNNSLAGIHMFLYSDTLSWFWANQSALSAEQRSNKYQFDSLWFDPTGAWIHNLLEVSMLTITPSMRLSNVHLKYKDKPIQAKLYSSVSVYVIHIGVYDDKFAGQ